MDGNSTLGVEVGVGVVPCEKLHHLSMWSNCSLYCSVMEGGVMPKEVIQYLNGDKTELDVRWNREAEWVQIKLERPERVVCTAGSGEPTVSETVESVTVFSDVLTRQDINKLIRVLRRARDAAYGADA